MKSQNEQILAHLKQGRAITPALAYERFGCLRLGARIYDLKQAGIKIIAKSIQKNGKRFAEYRMA